MKRNHTYITITTRPLLHLATHKPTRRYHSLHTQSSHNPSQLSQQTRHRCRRYRRIPSHSIAPLSRSPGRKEYHHAWSYQQAILDAFHNTQGIPESKLHHFEGVAASNPEPSHPQLLTRHPRALWCTQSPVRSHKAAWFVRSCECERRTRSCGTSWPISLRILCTRHEEGTGTETRRRRRERAGRSVDRACGAEGWVRGRRGRYD